MSKRIAFLFLIVVVFCMCSRRAETNIINFKKITIGQSESEVIMIMESPPFEVIKNDYVYLNQVKITGVTTFKYSTPTLASSLIIYHFKNDTLINKFCDC